MPASPEHLIFVYNADGGWWNAIMDMVHKIVSPATYPCSLCALTYGTIAMRPQWRRFVAGLPHAARFLHRDELAAACPGLTVALPTILMADEGGAPQVLVAADELDALPDLAALIALLEARLADAAKSAS